MSESLKRQRILTLDLLRGLFLVIIFAGHLAYAPSLFFQFATGTSGQFASAAEGFFAISGILVGYIYGPKILTHTKKIVLKMWKRAFLLYGLCVGFTLFYVAWAMLLPDGYSRQPNWEGPAIDLLVQSFTLQFRFGWADFLARYAVFMFIAPLAIWLIAKRHAWAVAVSSIGVWLFSGNIAGWQIFTAWQVVFMIGIIIGFYLPQLEAAAKSIPKRKKTIIWLSVVGLAVATYSAVMIRYVVLPFITPAISDTLPSEWLPYLDRESVGIARIAIGILWFSALYLLFRRFEEWINSATKGVLLTLGQNSLFVYSLEAFVIFSIDVFLPAPNNSSIIGNTLIGVGAMAAIYIITRYKALPFRKKV